MTNTDFNDPMGLTPVKPDQSNGLTPLTPGNQPPAPAATPAPVVTAPKPTPAPTAPAAPRQPVIAPPSATATGEPPDLTENPYQQQITAWKQAGASDDEITAGMQKLLQPQIDDWKAKGATDDEINAGVAKILGYNPSTLPQIQQAVQQNVAADPPVKPASTIQEFTDQIFKYGGLALIINGAPPPPEVQPADSDIAGQVAQAAGQVAQATPGAFAFAYAGGAAGSFIEPGLGTLVGAGLGALSYYALDAFVRHTYADASAKGQTTRPDFADNLVQHAADAIKETALFAPSMLVGGPAGKLGEQMAIKYGANWLAKATAKWGSRGFAELAAMTVAQDTIAGKLEPWQTTVANAILLAGMHGATAAVKAAVGAARATAPPDPGKLDQMTPAAATQALVQHAAVTGESSDAALARIQQQTSAPGIQQTAAGAKVKVSADVVKGYQEAGLDNFAPAVRTKWFSVASSEGVDAANAILKSAGNNPDAFHNDAVASLLKKFQADPAKYGGDLEAFVDRFDSKPPPSPEMQQAMAARVNDKNGKEVPPVINVPASVPSMGGILRFPVRTLRRVFNPTSVDSAGRDAGALIRTNTGLAARATAQGEEAMKAAKVRKAIAKVPDVLPILDHIEGRRGDTGIAPPSFGETQKAADTMRNIIASKRAALNLMGKNAPGAEEFYPNLWTDKKAARDFLKGRDTWPTVAEGIRAGLEPTSDPVSAVQQYGAHMDQAIALAGIRDVAEASGYWKHTANPPDGWVALKGPLSKRVNPTGPDLQAYAPEGFARVYNNFISKGFGEFGDDWKDAYDGVQRVVNGINATKLALSGYHAMVVTKASITNGLAQGFDELMSGHPVMALKTFGTFPFRPLTSLFKGYNIQNIYTGQRAGTDMDNRIVDLVTEAGGRLARGRQAAIDLTMSKVGSYVTSFLQGTLGAELKADVNTIAKSPLIGPVKVVAENTGRVFQTIGQPLFDKYIPWIKNAATYNHVASWLARNPAASHADALAATRYIVDRMDDRFGEMVHDNIFTNKFVKQMGSAMLLSWSWTVGEDIRTIGGGAQDTLKFFKDVASVKPPTWTPKMSYILASAVTTAAIGSMIQFAFTGKWPDNPLDAFAPKTGGTDARGNAERLQIPGPEKDIWETMANGLQGEAWNKTSAALQMAHGLWTNKDWKGDPIAAWNVPEGSGLPGTGWQNILGEYVQYIYQNAGVPIVMSQPHPQGSAINPVESLLGFREATPMLRNPDSFASNKEFSAERDWIAKLKSDAKLQAEGY